MNYEPCKYHGDPDCLSCLESNSQASALFKAVQARLTVSKGLLWPWSRPGFWTPTRLLVTGSRHWTDWEAVNDLLQEYPEDTTVIIGGAPGLDSIAERISNHLGFKGEVYKANWAEYTAGPIRNQQMLDEGKPTEVLAFPTPDSKGTLDMVKRSLKAGLPVRIWYDGHEIDDVHAWVVQHYLVDLQGEIRQQFLLAYNREPTAHELVAAYRKVLAPAKQTLFRALYGMSPQLNRRRLGIETKP